MRTSGGIAEEINESKQILKKLNELIEAGLVIKYRSTDGKYYYRMIDPKEEKYDT